MTIPILSIRCGKAVLNAEDWEPSAIEKRAVAGSVRVLLLGLEGDEQGNLSVHGGPDKAIHHYAQDHYAWWLEKLGHHPLLAGPGAFGENVSTLGMTDETVCIGDHYRFGSALVEVSHGRQPCFKLDRRFGGLAIGAAMVKARCAGWYYRVIEEGEVAAGDGIDLTERPHPEWSVARTFGLLVAGDHKKDRAGLEALGEVRVLAEAWERRRVALLG